MAELSESEKINKFILDLGITQVELTVAAMFLVGRNSLIEREIGKVPSSIDMIALMVDVATCGSAKADLVRDPQRTSKEMLAQNRTILLGLVQTFRHASDQIEAAVLSREETTAL